MDDVAGFLDNADVLNFAQVYQHPALPTPVFLILNFTSTDAFGGSCGPHGDCLRDLVMPNTDTRIGLLLKILEAEGVLDQTLIILTSDHGMELQDTSRAGSTVDKLGETSIVFVRAGDFVYFKTLGVTLSTETFVPDQSSAVEVTVIDEDSLFLDVSRPVENAVVTFSQGTESWTGTTNAEGKAKVNLTPKAGELRLDVTHPSYTPKRVVYTIP